MRDADHGIFASAAADQYDRFVGRYAHELARSLIAETRVRSGQRVVDVGCGPGALAAELVEVVGAGNVAAIDPSPSFVEACQARLPGVEVRVGAAEALPYDDRTFDAALAQLVLNFMTDAETGVREMARVTRRGGRIGVATWDYSDGMTMLRTFWDAAVALDPGGRAVDETATMRYCRPDEMEDLLTRSGLRDVAISQASPMARYDSFGDLWSAFEGRIGPAGLYVQSLGSDRRGALRDEFRRRLGVGDAPFQLSARAWIGVGTVS